MAVRLGAAETPWVTGQPHAGDFTLAQGGQVAPILIAPEDFKVVHIAADLLAQDLGRVTGTNATVLTDAASLKAPAVIAGTLGQSAVIDQLVADGKLDAAKLKGQWESFVISTVANPLPGVNSALVIVGSDRRGTAYGIFELSQAIGVSPWYWWADVATAHQDALFVAAGTRRFGPPSVQYRGFFINDEDWGLNPWAAKTFEPAVGNIGPKTYAKVFELLLRLKANTLWPAMHECSTAFNAIPENKAVADDYGIVMGASHCEPMLRNNVGEWPKDNQPAFNFITNPEGVTKYWEERVAENGKYENLYTIGMRGIHDSPMMGPRTPAEHVATLEKVFDVQRGLLAKYVNPDPSQVPQIFCAYKEVLGYYLNDLAVPPDVTLVFPDDNFGYIRYFPTPEQIAARPGGFGVYYHISYLGAPFSYVWLDTTPPALIWEEMSKAYDHGIRKFWMLNVGDIKPGEIGIDLFMQMAWDINKWNLKTLPDFLPAWAAQQFGPEHAKEIAAVMNEYYRLGFQRKPEQLQWYLGREPYRPSDFTYVDYNNEGRRRLADYQALSTAAATLGNELPAAKRDAFFELVGYPVDGAALSNGRFLASELAAQGLAQNRATTGDWAALIDKDTAQMVANTAHYNEIGGGKWQNIMSDDVLRSSRSYRDNLLTIPAGLAEFTPPGPGIDVAVEGQTMSLAKGGTPVLPRLNPFTAASRFIDIFNTPAGTLDISPKADWIVITRAGPNQPMRVSVDWPKAPTGADVSGTIVITDGKNTYTVKVPVYNPAELRPAQLAGMFVESNGVVSMLAQDYSRKVDKPGAAWAAIPGLGRTGNAVAVFPTTAPFFDVAQAAADAPELEYDFYVFRAGNVTVNYNLIPTQPIRYGTGLRFAVAMDDGPPQLVDITAGTGSESGVSRAWQMNVLSNTTTAATTHTLTPGAHKLRIYGLNPGVLLEKIVIDAGGLRPSYLGPPETKVAAAL